MPFPWLHHKPLTHAFPWFPKRVKGDCGPSRQAEIELACAGVSLGGLPTPNREESLRKGAEQAQAAQDEHDGSNDKGEASFWKALHCEGSQGD